MSDKAATDSKSRFTGRAESYSKYRPSYPAALLDVLRREAGLVAETVVADIGSGTGILTELFLRNGNTVFAVEPNAEMRQTAERLLSSYGNFRSVAGSAENTTLPDISADLITAGQSFHWFSLPEARKEFSRISRNGIVAVIYNSRDHKESGFNADYEKLIGEYGRNFSRVGSAYGNKLSEFFSEYSRFTFDNPKRLDLEGLTGRLLSASYMPVEGEARYGEMLDSIGEMFERNREGGTVTMQMTTELFLGRL